MSSTAPEVSTSEAPKRAVRLVHYCSVRAAEVARELGVQVRYICGEWSSAAPHKADQRDIVTMGDIERHDCPRCVELALRQMLRAAPHTD